MAASDQTYRNQKTLDYVFAVSGVLLLIGTVWMFVQDFNRPFKAVQREFRDVEEAMAQRDVLALAPDEAKLAEIEEAEKGVKAAQEELAKIKDQSSKAVNAALPKQIEANNNYSNIKADYDSIVSLYDIAVGNFNAANDANDTASSSRLKREVDSLYAQVQTLKGKLDEAKVALDQQNAALNEALAPQQEAAAVLSKAEDRLKELTANFDRFARLVEQKRWGLGDRFRTLPILDAFASPTRINQTFHDDLPINYSFKYVTRYDRCTTCHLGIEKPTYTPQALGALGDVAAPELQTQLTNARNALEKRQKIRQESGGISPSDLRLQPVALTSSQVKQYSAHPRLDLFVDAASPHPGQTFGCTICHAGQGSATDFYNASHTPNDSKQTAAWEKDHHWHSSHYWDFPMQPSRFIESSCVKCHHEMTDLVREGSRIEAPKVMRGYQLVLDNGCFGCHEISGLAGGRRVGPDLRLEPTPPLSDYTPAERAKMTSDPLNPPGTLRKVGPSLRRLSEKTNSEWLIQWLRAPREFRPDTKMPHFYGLSNNHPEVLPADQKQLPDAEIHAIAYYLMNESGSYLKGQDKYRQFLTARLQDLQDQQKAKTISEAGERQLLEIGRMLELNGVPTPLPELPETLQAKASPEQLYAGRKLFSERGCLACHQHTGTEQSAAKGPEGKPELPTIAGDAKFGPNLSRLAAKLGTKAGDEASARRWLVQWIMNPSFHFPRTRMPVTHLTQTEANDIASWLLSIKVTDDWAASKVPAPNTQTLKDLARVFLSRAYTKREVEEILEKGIDKKRLDEDKKPLNADERELETAPGDVRSIDHKLKMYIGKKAVGQLGCYACHDVPGFETAKPIGTPLNDWGKKDPERLAFEDAISFVNKNYDVVPKLRDEKGNPVAGKGGKTPYEKYFYDLLNHHKREGFLHQKLSEPRSYDYERLRAWDDRLRMPQFKFARTERKADESDEAYKQRADVEEAEAREAVMTFVLGLIAEPIPQKYVNNPKPDRLAEVKGRQVLDKFNCAGCHLVRPGVYEFKVTPEVQENLEAYYKTASGFFGTEHFFPNHNAWVGTNPTRPDRLTAHGVRRSDPADDTGETSFLTLSQALRFYVKGADGKNEPRDFLSSNTIGLPKELLSQADPYGGTFSDLLVPYLMRLDKQRYGDEGKARPAVPPSLLRQGEKTQPLWLFNFLRNPHEIRPVTVLRMPKFNMSDDDAMALVNYFSAVDKLGNPATGVSYPYLSVPEQAEGYLASKTPTYIDLLKQDKKSSAYEKRVEEMKPVWEETQRTVKAQLAGAQNQLNEAETKLKAVQEAEKNEQDAGKKKVLEDARKEAEDLRDSLKRDIERLEGEVKASDLKAQQERWESKLAYATDAYRLVASPQGICLNCHQVGSTLPKEKQGPNLALAWERLRPDWTEHWLANPQRFMPYPIITPMPQNFPKGKSEYQNLFHGTPREQVSAARDALMNYPRLLDLPANRSRPVVVAGGGK